jgi:hypothetical protein
VSVFWYVQTAGVHPDDGYAWLSVDGDVDVSKADAVVYGNLAGRPLLKLTSERTPSVVLGRLASGGFVLFANRLPAPHAPAKGDYQGRTITATLLGVALPGTDPAALLDAAAAACTDELADLLPLTWSDGRPRIDRGVGQWPPPARRPEPGAVRPALAKGVALPSGEAATVATELAGLTADDLAAFAPNQLILLRTEALGRADLLGLQPWRAISSELTVRVTFPRERKSRVRELTWLILSLVGLAVIVWLIVRGRGRG